MPIRPEDKIRYPADWPAISWRIRHLRARGRCEICGIAVHGLLHPVTGSRVVLTVAHLNHRPEDCRPNNLRAACQRCHLALDSEHHRARALQTRRRRLACGDLFLGLQA